MNIGYEKYEIRGGGMYDGYLYDRVQREGEGYIRNTFYAGVKADGSAEDDMITGYIATNKISDPITDKQITEAFAEGLGDKIRASILFGNEDYIKSFLTLPSGFYTQETCQSIIKPLLKAFVGCSPEQAERVEAARHQLLDYARHVNFDKKI